MQDNQNRQLSDSCKSTTQNQEDKNITDLWGAMSALFGVRWSSQFGEKVDVSGQWKKTLSGMTRLQISAAIDEVRLSGRSWPPTAPEFRAMCASAGKAKPLSTESAYAEVCAIIRSGSKNYDSASPYVYHTIRKNLDWYTFMRLSDSDSIKMFSSAYKATLFQVDSGDTLKTPPPPETLIDSKPAEKYVPTPEILKTGEEEINKLKSMFD